MENDLRKKTNSQYILELKNLKKTFAEINAVNNVSLEVEKGDVFGFLGPNGAGKTTTIRMILGLIHLDKGKIIIDGYDIEKDFQQAIKKVGAVVETPRFYEYLSGYQNLIQIIRLHPELDNSRIDEVLNIVGLKQRADDKVKNYSLGMKQRLGIARALINNPELIILDEPTNGLDPQGMREVRSLIDRLAHNQDITFFISTHLLNEVEQICNKVAILKKGQIIVSDLVSSLLNEEQETVEIITQDIKLVKKIIEQLNYAKISIKTDQGILVKLDKGYAAQLNTILIENDVSVEYLVPRSQSLEDYFIDITQEGDEIV